MLPILIIYLCYYVTGISAEFDMDEELAKIKKLCLTVEDHYEIAGKRVNEARVVYHYTFFNVAVDIIGLTENAKSSWITTSRPFGQNINM
ncbi:unnamed protein product [Caenorhabditis angaria]|uniref:Uncharacterized protein n=1 Tax=Caenorhabditis angaria TaxID=860376 RepID=A0A9P1I8I1_9PELO|nr:unnamed protein product [Caenorhabditis angaria]